MRFVIAYLALVATVAVGFALWARREELKAARVRLNAFKNRPRP